MGIIGKVMLPQDNQKDFDIYLHVVSFLQDWPPKQEMKFLKRFSGAFSSYEACW